jgi:predicted  nucleic acid-binding Zn-ribbon protein
MAKNTSKKIKQLRGEKPEKLTNEQLDKVQKTINNLNRIQIEIGTIEVRKHELMHSIAGLKDELTLLQSEFEKEYGTYDIDIKDGTINYPKENGKINKKD